MKPLHIAVAAIAVALVVGTAVILAFRLPDDGVTRAADPTPASVTLTSSPFYTPPTRGRSPDNRVGPSEEQFAIGAGVLAAAITVGVALVARRRSKR